MAILEITEEALARVNDSPTVNLPALMDVMANARVRFDSVGEVTIRIEMMDRPDADGERKNVRVEVWVGPRRAPIIGLWTSNSTLPTACEALLVLLEP